MLAKKHQGPEKRKEQAKFTPSEFLPTNGGGKITQHSNLKSPFLHKKYGGFMATMRGNVDAKAVLIFSWAGQPVKVKLRQSDKNKQVYIHQYQWHLVVVDKEGNILREIERTNLPKV